MGPNCKRIAHEISSGFLQGKQIVALLQTRKKIVSLRYYSNSLVYEKKKAAAKLDLLSYKMFLVKSTCFDSETLPTFS